MKISENLHLIIGTVILIGCVYFYVGSFKKTQLLIDSFEGKIGADTTDYGSSSNSSMQALASTKFSKCGMQSLELRYDLKPSGYVYCARGHGLYHRKDVLTWKGGRAGWLIPPDKIDWNDFDAFSFYMRGDNNGKVAIDIKDSGGELWRSFVQINSNDWQKFVLPFNEFEQRKDWQPDKADQNYFMDFPITSFQFEPKEPGERVLNIDCAKLIKL